MKKLSLLALLAMVVSPLMMAQGTFAADETVPADETAVEATAGEDDILEDEGDALEEEVADGEEATEEALDEDAEVDAALAESFATAEEPAPIPVNTTVEEVKQAKTGIAGIALAGALALGGAAIGAHARKRKENY